MADITSKRRRPILAVAAIVAIGAAGCSDDPSAEERVCDALVELRDAVDGVVTDVQAANFGDARAGVAAVGEASDELGSALDQLSEEQRQALAPDVEAVAADIDALDESENLDELGNRLDAVLSGAQGVYDQTTETLQCD